MQPLMLYALILLMYFSPMQTNAFGPGDGKRASKKAAPKRTEATELRAADIRIDGKLDEEFWQRAVYVDDFKQQSPFEGEDATERTKVAFAYDDNYFYVGARMYSDDPSSILANVARRDGGRSSERLIISLDTFLDRRTAYSFSISAAGVRGDYYHPSDSDRNRDMSYNPVWVANAKIDSLGWTAEMKIPFSQLRFDDKDIQTWGLNINRWIPSKNEDAFWVMIPRNDNGWSSRFGNLEGIKDVVPKRRIEILPYAAGNAFSPAEFDRANPFINSTNLQGQIGGDLKLGLGPNLTLDATINPDFGQVEADPAVVNLSIFEVQFDERRPFFTEGAQLFNSRGADYFYSRRIGDSPTLRPDADFVDRDNFTSIIGASKLTGRLPSGLSVGALFAATAQERARTFNESDDPTVNRFGSEIIEPLTSYEVLRVQQEFGVDAPTFGAILTGVQRNNSSNPAFSDVLTDQAYSGGADWNLRFQGGKYQISGDVGFSYVEGSEEAILRLQRRSSRYYQRPDADYVSIDSSATSMSGYRASLDVSKNAGKHWLWSVDGSINSPGFELNDIGILRNTDRYRLGGRLTYRENTPGRFFNRWNMNVRANYDWNFGGIQTGARYGFGADFNTNNFWGINLGGGYRPRTLSDNLTRGGPLMGRVSEWSLDGSVRSNFGLPRFGRIGGRISRDEVGSHSWRVNGSFRVTTNGPLEWSISPRYSRQTDMRQYLQRIEGTGGTATFGNRYVFSEIERSTLSLQFRVNYSINPDLSIEVYAEPFASSGDFRNPGELTEARSYDIRRYNIIGRTAENDLLVEDQGQQFEVRDPDFVRRSFRSNVVMRWEFIPGSTLFLVWQQNRNANLDEAFLVRPDDLSATFNQRGDTLIAIKFAYWFSAN